MFKRDEPDSVNAQACDQLRRQISRVYEKLNVSRADMARFKLASQTCWLCENTLMTIDIIPLLTVTAVAEEIAVPLKMQCNGGHSLCVACAESTATNFLGDKQSNTMCCKYFTVWPGNVRSKLCGKTYAVEQMHTVLAPKLLVSVAEETVLRRERSAVAVEAVTRRADSAATNRDILDDIFVFKTPCCGLAFDSDACMAVHCEPCKRYFCQLCMCRMEVNMTQDQAHRHVMQCTWKHFRRSFLFPAEIDEAVLPKNTVHLAMKGNAVKMYQLRCTGEETLSHPNMASDNAVDFSLLATDSRRDALDVKIADVDDNPAAEVAENDYNARHDALEVDHSSDVWSEEENDSSEEEDDSSEEEDNVEGDQDYKPPPRMLQNSPGPHQRHQRHAAADEVDHGLVVHDEDLTVDAFGIVRAHAEAIVRRRAALGDMVEYIFA